MHSAMATAASVREQGARVRVDNRRTPSHRPLVLGVSAPDRGTDAGRSDWSVEAEARPVGRTSVSDRHGFCNGHFCNNQSRDPDAQA